MESHHLQIPFNHSSFFQPSTKYKRIRYLYLMRILILLVGLFGTTIIFSQDLSLNVMSFNIRFANPGDGEHDWNHRRPLVKSVIQFHEADLIGVQEALRSQLEDMKKDMPEYEWFGVCRNDGSANPNPDGEFSAILYRKDRFEKLDGNTFWLSLTPDIPGSKDWDANITRIVTWAKFRDRTNNKIFYHFNTHFDHIGVQARAESAKLIREKINSIAGNEIVILTGDFNCSDQETPYQIITDPKARPQLSDALYKSKIPHHGPLASFAGNFRLDGLIDHRIDFIFISDHVIVNKHAILSDNWNGNLASDHLPVLAEIKI